MKMLKLAAVAGMTMLLACMALAGCGSSQQEAQSAGSAAQENEVSAAIGELSYCVDDETIVKKAHMARMLGVAAIDLSSYFVLDESLTELPVNLDEVNTVEDLQPMIDEIEVKQYDTLTSMLMALRSGEIGRMCVYEPVAEYIMARNDDVKALIRLDKSKMLDANGDAIADQMDAMLSTPVSDNFAFLMMEKNTTLRDEFNAAIKEMQADGTDKALFKEYIQPAADGKDLKAVELPKIEGADTVKVGVTGDMPPFDFISDDGTPAGYNTALLAEISKRIGKNIELVNIDAGSRIMALSQGTVDVVFWTRCALSKEEIDDVPPGGPNDESVRQTAEANGLDADKLVKAINLSRELLTIEEKQKLDLPEGTIRSNVYFSAPMVMMEKA